MFLSILKKLLFASVVLLLGQIHVGGETIAGRFQKEVSHAWSRASHELRRTAIYDRIANYAVRSQWSHRKIASADKPRPFTSSAENAERTARNDAAPKEDISPSDRESLLRLLQ